MIFITKTKKTKEYKMPEMPNFENRIAKVVWLRRQQMLASVLNIKSVSVQVKDIKKMIYSKNPRLLSLYAKFHLSGSENFYDNDDYITILKNTDLNKSLIYALISSDWLLNVKEVENKSTEELHQEYADLQIKIASLNESKKQMINPSNTESKIKLLEYKLACLTEVILTKVNSDGCFKKQRK